MPNRFYAAWTISVILALALPVIIPYLIWPTYESLENRSHLSAADWTAHSASDNALYTRALPNSVSFAPCTAGPGLHQNGYSALVTLRGAFGLPIASLDYDCSNDYPMLPDGRHTPPMVWKLWGLFLATGGLIAGAVAVSFPFWVLQERRRDGRDRSHWFLDMPNLRQPHQTEPTQW